METLTNLLFKSKYRNCFVSSDLIHSLVGGSSSRRWGLVNRAIKSSELLRLRRGLYSLNPSITNVDLSKMYIANSLVAESYVSCETALSYYGWLQEESKSVQSCIYKGRFQKFENSFGYFTYENVSVVSGTFLAGVNRIVLSGKSILIASPERAFCDVVLGRKLEWAGLVDLCEQLRTDITYIYNLDLAKLTSLSEIYKSQKVKTLLKYLIDALGGSYASNNSNKTG